MSSILDALNKLEEERNRQLREEQAAEEKEEAPFEPEEAAAKLLAYEPLSGKRVVARRPAAGGRSLSGWFTAGISLLALAAVASSAIAVVLAYQVSRQQPAPREAYTVPVVIEAPGHTAQPTAGTAKPAPGETPAPRTVPVAKATPRQSVPAEPAKAGVSTPEPVQAPEKPSQPAGSAGRAEPTPKESVAKPVPVQPEPPRAAEPKPQEPMSDPAESPVDAVPPDAAVAEGDQAGEPPVVGRAASAEPDITVAPTEPVKVAQATQSGDKETDARAGDGLTPPATLPENPPVVAPPPLPVNPPAALRAPVASTADPAPARKSAGFVDPEVVNALPRLTLADQERYGLGELRLNVLREAGPGNPDPVAIINLKKVYLGERIPGTRARLVGISSRAIAIEIEDTGARFRVSR